MKAYKNFNLKTATSNGQLISTYKLLSYKTLTEAQHTIHLPLQYQKKE